MPATCESRRGSSGGRILSDSPSSRSLFNTSAYSPFHKDMLAPLMTPGTCGIWAQGGAGYDDVDVQFLTESNCVRLLLRPWPFLAGSLTFNLAQQWFSNTPYAVTSSTADMALLLTLQVLRGSTEAEANARAGKWRAGLGLTKDPQGLRLGIVGMGAIGSCLATRAGALGMEVVYNNRTPLSREDEASKAGGAKWIAFDELLATSDVISMNCPLNENTRHLLGEKEFEKMKGEPLLAFEVVLAVRVTDQWLLVCRWSVHRQHRARRRH